MNLSHKASELPFIFHPTTKQKILMDTTSSRSFINPNLAQQSYSKLIQKDRFKISTIHGTSSDKYSMSGSFPEIFRSNEKLNFYLFKFHDNFDWLLGMDSLKKLNAIVNFKDHSLILPNFKFKLFYRETTPQFHHLEHSTFKFSHKPSQFRRKRGTHISYQRISNYF